LDRVLGDCPTIFGRAPDDVLGDAPDSISSDMSGDMLRSALSKTPLPKMLLPTVRFLTKLSRGFAARLSALSRMTCR